MTPSANLQRIDLLDALIYGDIFDCAVTLDELWRYARVAIDRDQLCRRFRCDPVLRRLVAEREGFYCFQNRLALFDRRPGRIARAGRLQRRANLVARVLSNLPFVRGLILTGSVSADDATETADIDLLVIVAAGRIGGVFLFLGALSRLLGRSLFCPNWYISEDRLCIAPASLYYARELAQSRSPFGNADDLRRANSWIQDVFPNAAVPTALQPKLKERTSFQRLLEGVLAGVLGPRFETWARGVAAARLHVHYSGFGLAVPAETAERLKEGLALGFFGRRYEQAILKAYAARRALLSERLAQAEHADDSGPGLQADYSRPALDTAC